MKFVHYSLPSLPSLSQKLLWFYSLGPFIEFLIDHEIQYKPQPACSTFVVKRANDLARYELWFTSTSISDKIFSLKIFTTNICIILQLSSKRFKLFWKLTNSNLSLQSCPNIFQKPTIENQANQHMTSLNVCAFTTPNTNMTL